MGRRKRGGARGGVGFLLSTSALPPFGAVPRYNQLVMAAALQLEQPTKIGHRVRRSTVSSTCPPSRRSPDPPCYRGEQAPAVSKRATDMYLGTVGLHHRSWSRLRSVRPGPSPCPHHQECPFAHQAPLNSRGKSTCSTHPLDPLLAEVDITRLVRLQSPQRIQHQCLRGLYYQLTRRERYSNLHR